MGSCVFAVLLLYRRISSIGRLSKFLWGGVLLTVAWVISAGVTHFHAAQAFDFPPGAFAPSTGFFTGFGLRATGDRIRLLGLLQHLLSCRRSGEAGTQRAPRGADFRRVGRGHLPADERQRAGRDSLARIGQPDEPERAFLGDFGFHAADLRRMGGQGRNGANYLDGLRFGFFAAAGLFARPVRRRAGWQLLRGIRQAASEVSFPLRFAAGDGSGGHGILRACNLRT